MLRAGRLDEALARLSEGIAAAREVEFPTDWTYLALAYARKGDFLDSHRWLERLRAWQPDSTTTFWDIQEIGLLRSEAEALILDAGFPTNPFAHLDR
jgi:hypothetical protein